MNLETAWRVCHHLDLVANAHTARAFHIAAALAGPAADPGRVPAHGQGPILPTGDGGVSHSTATRSTRISSPSPVGILDTCPCGRPCTGDRCSECEAQG